MHQHYSYKIIEQARQQICTLEDIKNYSRISTDNDDQLLESMINTAIQVAENFIKHSIIRKVVEVEINLHTPVLSDIQDMNFILDICYANYGKAMQVKLPFIPVAEIIKIEADDQELDLENVVINDEILTLTKYVECKKFKVIYASGHNDPKMVPAPIVQGIIQHVSNMYDARGAGAVSIDGVLQLYSSYRKMSIF